MFQILLEKNRENLNIFYFIWQTSFEIVADDEFGETQFGEVWGNELEQAPGVGDG